MCQPPNAPNISQHLPTVVVSIFAKPNMSPPSVAEIGDFAASQPPVGVLSDEDLQRLADRSLEAGVAAVAAIQSWMNSMKTLKKSYPSSSYSAKRQEMRNLAGITAGFQDQLVSLVDWESLDDRVSSCPVHGPVLY